MQIWDLPATEDDAVTFLQEHGILPSHRICTEGHQMKLYFGTRVFWSCNIRSCRQNIGMRVGNWFKASKISFLSAVRFIYCWCEELTSIKWCQQQLNFSDKTTIDWNNYMREVCIMDLERNCEGKIGGEGMVVEINKTLFNKHKDNKSHTVFQQWMLIGICDELKQTFLVSVDDFSISTLLELIKKHVKEGSILYSDSWKSCCTSELDVANFEDFKVKHDFTFTDPDTGCNIQVFKPVLESSKWKNKKRRITAKQHFDSYVAEYCWRQKHRDEDLFEAVLRTISELWPPEIEKHV